MFKLKVKHDGETYSKKFATMREVFNEIHFVLFGEYSKRPERINVGELNETKKLFKDTRFYLTILAD
ncbi:MAG: hypothetical protein IJ371_01820 [Clostridia bacterium]|nr:hypothetical protein [Clostridia bacterium]